MWKNDKNNKYKLGGKMTKMINIIDILLKKMIKKEIYLKFKGMYKIKYLINIHSPKTFNEKLNFRKLYDKNPLFGVCVNKYYSKEYVRNIIGIDISPKTLFIGDEISKMDFRELPEKFVIKTTNASGSKFYDIIENKSICDLEKIIRKYNKIVKIKYGKQSYEPWYDYTKQQIIIEEYLEMNNHNSIEMKVYCFNNGGNFDVIYRVIKDRFEKKTQSFYNKDWEYLDIGYNNDELHDALKKPDYLDYIFEISKRISNEFDFIRIDYLIFENRIYFGELTVADSSGFIKFDKIHWDNFIGEKWTMRIN